MPQHKHNGNDSWIGYGTTDAVDKYRRELDEVVKNATELTAIDALRTMLARWAYVAPDAIVVADGMNTEMFWVFARGLAKERKGQFAGEEWMEKFGAILIPTRMLRVSVTAEHFVVPWGLAYIRMRDEGKLDG